MNDEVSEFVSALLHSSTVTHFMHWSTNSYSKHKALGKYYERIIELTDDFAPYDVLVGKDVAEGR